MNANVYILMCGCGRVYVCDVYACVCVCVRVCVYGWLVMCQRKSEREGGKVIEWVKR